MKKFFSLVLALVMALSLTTVAWGATKTVFVKADFVGTSDGTEAAPYTTLAEAIAATGDGDTIKLLDGDYSVHFTNDTAFNVDGRTIVGLGEDVNLAISSSEVWYGRIQGNNVVFENITFTTNTVGATGKATYNNCTFEGRLECASSGDAETYAYNCVIGEVHTSTDMNAGAAHFENCKIAVAAYNAKDTMTFTGGSIGELKVWGGDTVLSDVEIAPEKISYEGSGNDTIVMDDSLVASDAATLITAMKAATSGATIKLLDDITVSEDWHSGANGANFSVPVTIDGNGKTLKLTGKVTEPNYNAVFRFGDTATVKNLTIDASGATGIQRGISSKGSIVVEECTLIGNGTGYGVIFGEGAGAANIGNVTATVTNSTFTNWAKGVSDNANAQDAKSVSITGSTFDNADVNVSAKETVTFTGNTVVDGSVIIHTYTANSDLAVTATGNTLDADAGDDNKIKAKTVTTDSNDFAIIGATMTAPAGYVVLKTTTGAEVVVPAVAFGDKYDLYQADAGMNAALKAKNPDVAGLSFDEFDAKTNKDGSGRVAYIAANNGEYFVKTTSPTIVDYAVTDAGKNTVLYYVTVAGTSAANFEYEEAVSAFTNFGVKCDQVNITPVAGATYFKAADGDVYMADDAGTGVNYLLNGKVVSGVHAGTPEEHTFVINNYKYDATLKQNIPTSAVCTKCLMNTGSIYLRTKVPATYTLYTTTGEGSVNYTVALPGASAVVPSVPSTDKVQSAETFDAGIAMYVGMSVMAAAGSAVVLKKRED